jgi:5-methyltetrahydrofolate--homocysteine methyltransferase
MLKKIIKNKWLEARGVIGFYPANTVDHDDIELYSPEGEKKVVGRLHTLRQQVDRDQDGFVAMSDFIAPKETGV